MGLMKALGGHLRPLDRELAATLRRLEPDTPELVLAGAALASLAVSQGHAGFDPARPRQLVADGIDWPAPDDWTAALSASDWVATGGDGRADNRPLVFEGGLLYLRRYREYEQRLATRLHALAARRPAAVDEAALAPVFDALFPAGGSDPLQARAASMALRRALLLVTGGPGTGKTTTIARMLVLLVAQASLADAPAPRIALAAPTGRAAERMAGSLQAAAARLAATAGIDPAWLDALPRSAGTLHRLLGTIPGSPRFRHDADHPLPFDVVVVDEASMVDLPLMCKLAEAVPDGARLVLLGDPDQLPSVEAGDVLAAICQAAGTDDGCAAGEASAATPATAVGATGDLFEHGAIDGGSRPKPPLHGHRVHLLRGYRQSAGFGLAPLAAAVRDGDAHRALALLRGGTLAGVHFHEDAADPLAVATGLLPHWRALADAADPAAALAAAAGVRLLTALRGGPQGTGPLNARIEEALAGPRPPLHFPGRLLLVDENSHRHRLFNGDVGICLRDDDGTLLAWFADGAGGVRAFHPSALPRHQSAFAMTVHKAQGSEFDTVWLQLPRNEGSRVLSRELVYTALTRARRELHLCAGAEVLRGALGRHVERVSGLHRRLVPDMGGA
ncbi:exodeoxyribonuclease V subunit alpha [Novilysobacter arseniciresistens]|uniref:exodeoxyribonuclease V subunit alpha n=1 Tax=Novilysobacter arseniciresistens TaxID=1385522 RepID=UPI0006895DEC|nr:exodeoxyribonuclease V subunit alpha [Lysobacter arseniciresistens]